MFDYDNKAQLPKVHCGAMQVLTKDMAMTNTQWIHTTMTNKTKRRHGQYTVEPGHERKHSHKPIQGGST
jgi:hypothetical protein